MKQVVDNETQNDDPAYRHRSRCRRGALWHMLGILYGAGGPVLGGELDREVYVGHKHRDKEKPDDPEDGPQAVQEDGIGIQLVGTPENLEIPCEVANDVGDQHEAGEGDYPFSADGRINEINDRSHQNVISSTEESSEMVLPG